MRKFTHNIDNKKKAAGVMPLAVSSGRVLLGLRPEGVYSSIGGYVCWGENLADAAIREFVEETLYDGPLLILKGYMYQSPVKDFEYMNFLGICPQEFNPMLDEENIEAEWFSLSQLYAGGLPLHKDFEEFLCEARPLIDSLMQTLGILSP